MERGIFAVHILEARVTVDDRFLGLASSEASRDFAMLFLAFVASTRRLALTRGRASSSADTFVVCAFGVG